MNKIITGNMMQQGIIHKKSAPSRRTLPLEIFDKKKAFFQKQFYFKVFLGRTTPKVPFLKIPDTAL